MNKLLTTLTLSTLLAFSSCGTKNSESTPEQAVVQQEPQHIQPTTLASYTEADSIRDLQKLQSIKRCAQRLIDDYQKQHPSPQNARIKNILSGMSFWRMQELPNNMGRPRSLDKTFTTSIMFCMTKTNIIVKTKGVNAGANSIMYTGSLEISGQNRRIFIISANQNKAFEAAIDTFFLGSSLIHEILHVIHRTDNPSIVSDDETESWTIQVAVIKAHLSPTNQKIYNQKLEEQRRKPYNYKQLYLDNYEWVRQAFGSVRGYIDKFAFDAYGKQAWSSTQSE